jgi:uncharacterized protein YndB with AHSA1/START domain/effector-binding domain-containing protein
MKWLKQLGILLIFIVLVTAGLSIALPTHQKIERTTTINAPASVVYEHLSKLEHFNKFATWSGRDSTAVYTLTGKDGTTGASQTWKGDPGISGEGKITIHSLEPGKKVRHAVQFTKPKKNNAESTFTLNESNGSTTVTWEFILATPRPWNIFNLLHSIDKEMGTDFDEGLLALKKSLEKNNTASASANTPEVQLMNFPATTFAVVRQIVKWEDLPMYVAANWEMLRRNVSDTTAFETATLIYDRDEKLRQTDIAAALKVQAGSKTESSIVQIIDIPASKAVYLDYDGPMVNANEMYPSIRKYLSDNSMKQTGPIFLQFAPTDSNVPGWQTGPVRIIFLVD